MDNAQEEEVVFTDEEIRLGVKIFKVLYFISIILLFLAIAAAVYIGFKGMLWYVAIPIWAACNFGLRVLKRYLRDILESFEVDMAALQASGTSDEDSDLHHKTESVANSRHSITTSYIVVLVMLAVSVLWYGVGTLLRIVF